MALLDPQELAAHSAWLGQLARRLLSNGPQAEDLVQETWIQALKSPPRTGLARSWLATVLLNQLRKNFRTERRRLVRERCAWELGETFTEDASELLARLEAQRLLTDLVKALAEPYRTTILLRYAEGLAPKEIARRHGVPDATVRWRLKHGLDQLRRALDDRYGSRNRWALALMPIAGGAPAGVGPRPGGGAIAGALGKAAMVACLGLGIWCLTTGGDGDASGQPSRAKATVAARLAAVTATTSGMPHEPAELSVRGQVTSVVTGPLTGAQVTAVPSNGARGPIATSTDSLGRYELPVTQGSYLLTVRAPGHQAATSELLAEVDVSRDFQLAPAAHLSGRVVLEDGTPVPGATVRARSGEIMVRAAQATTTDAAGRFRFDELDPGWYGIDARAGEFAGVAGEAAAALNGDGAPIDVIVRRGLRTRGRVVDEEDRPVPEAVVQGQVWSGVQAGLPSTTTNGRGEFELEGLLPTRLDLTARAPGFAARTLPAQLVGDDTPPFLFRLQRQATVLGHVRTPDGRPVTNAQVVMKSRAGAQAKTLGTRVQTAEDGTFRLEEIDPGVVTLLVLHPTGALTATAPPLAPGESRQWPLTLGRGSTIAGRVLDDRGAPIPHAEVRATLVDTGLHVASVQADADGRYQIGPLGVGEFFLRAIVPGDRRSPDAIFDTKLDTFVRVAEGDGDRTVDLHVPADDQQLGGRIVDQQGRGVEGAIISAAAELHLSSAVRQRALQRRSISRADGTFLVDGILPGKHTLWITHPGYAVALVGGVRAGRSDTRITLTRAAALELTVLDEQARPIPAYTCLMIPSPRVDESVEERDLRIRSGVNGRRAQARDEQGRLRVEGLVPGHYDLLVRTPDGRSGTLASHPVGLGGSQDRVVLRVEAGVTVTAQLRSVEGGLAVPHAVARGVAVDELIEETADRQGRLVIPHVPRGRDVLLIIRSPGFIDEEVELSLPRHATSFDLGTIHLQPGSLYRNRPDAAIAGVDAVLRDGRVIAAAVTPGLPAARAGIRRGDWFLAIDGQDVRAAGQGTVHALLRGRVGTPVTLTVQSPGGAPRTVSLRRVSGMLP